MEEKNTKREEVDFSVRVNAELKEKCTAFCYENNITLTEFVKAFIEKTVNDGKLPFAIDKVKSDDSKNVKSNSNALSKLHIRFNSKEMFERFREICEDNFLTYHVAVKAYMRICMEKNKIICSKSNDSSLYNTRDFMKFKRNEKARELKEKIDE